VALAFAGTVKFDEIDHAKRSARISAQGSDAKGRGGANASAVFRLEPTGDGSKVLVHTNLTLSGAVAQYGRGVGIIQATAAQLMSQFAKCLKEKLARETVARPALPTQDAATAPASPASPHDASAACAAASSRLAPASSAPATPISGFTLIAKSIWRAFTALFRRP
jgi:hypothetical protein